MKAENRIFWKGMDISFLPECMDVGMQVFDLDGTPMETFALLKKYGVNSIRLRIWVNPDNEPRSGGYCSLQHTLRMAKLVVDNGMNLVLDFHYSDWWADPGSQKKPKDWEGLTGKKLEEQVYSYTRETLLAFQAQGTLPNMELIMYLLSNLPNNMGQGIYYWEPICVPRFAGDGTEKFHFFAGDRNSDEGGGRICVDRFCQGSGYHRRGREIVCRAYRQVLRDHNSPRGQLVWLQIDIPR